MVAESMIFKNRINELENELKLVIQNSNAKLLNIQMKYNRLAESEKKMRDALVTTKQRMCEIINDPMINTSIEADTISITSTEDETVAQGQDDIEENEFEKVNTKNSNLQHNNRISRIAFILIFFV